MWLPAVACTRALVLNIPRKQWQNGKELWLEVGVRSHLRHTKPKVRIANIAKQPLLRQGARQSRTERNKHTGMQARMIFEVPVSGFGPIVLAVSLLQYEEPGQQSGHLAMFVAFSLSSCRESSWEIACTYLLHSSCPLFAPRKKTGVCLPHGQAKWGFGPFFMSAGRDRVVVAVDENGLVVVQ